MGETSKPISAARNGPGPLLADEPPRPGIESAGDGKFRNHFTKDEANQKLSGTREKIGPKHRWTADGESEVEHGIHADDRREVCEAEGEIFPRIHLAIESSRVAECCEPRGVRVFVVCHSLSPSMSYFWT
jgi:hypothetical protein